ncbi:hypothetical protein [Cytobacillus purgationiresistens]|uniref:Uncharacterized protein n=1 Tax=Cytobacillus purgationiresistens TaxID=863449 RepID=A0ABU0AGG1_9BACI|nr:hypothetical protein [Cytobacillus purgationiresistens]MDQ0270120.1 hypothetical protein [Cytobacillus purgationiresistens]
MNQNQFRGLMIVLIILIIAILFSFNNLAGAIRESSNYDGGINNELFRFNDNFEKYLEILEKNLIKLISIVETI